MSTVGAGCPRFRDCSIDAKKESAVFHPQISLDGSTSTDLGLSSGPSSAICGVQYTRLQSQWASAFQRYSHRFCSGCMQALGIILALGTPIPLVNTSELLLISRGSPYRLQFGGSLLQVIHHNTQLAIRAHCTTC